RNGEHPSHCEGLAVVGVVDHSDELVTAVQLVARSILRIGNYIVFGRIAHASRLRRFVASGTVLTRGCRPMNNQRMTIFQRPVSAWEANGSAGMVIAGSVAECCLVCC